MTRRPSDLKIVPRQPDFELTELFQHKRYWLKDDPVMTHFINALQSTFPEGERFFIDSARAVRDQVGEENLPEQLRRDIRDFIRQEAWHGKEHELWDRSLEAIGYTEMGRYSEKLKKLRLWANDNIKPINRLAMTAAAEHLTASLARLLLEKRPDLLDDAERPVRDLLAWHALEETEHKSVCFDLYQAAGGGYFRRSLMLVVELFDLFIQVHQRHRYLLQQDGLWNWKTRLRLFRDIWGPTGIMGQMASFLVRYLKPGFHPWETDERKAFIERFGYLLKGVDENLAA